MEEQGESGNAPPALTHSFDLQVGTSSASLARHNLMAALDATTLSTLKMVSRSDLEFAREALGDPNSEWRKKLAKSIEDGDFNAVSSDFPLFALPCGAEQWALEVEVEASWRSIAGLDPKLQLPAYVAPLAKASARVTPSSAVFGGFGMTTAPSAFGMLEKLEDATLNGLSMAIVEAVVDGMKKGIPNALHLFNRLDVVAFRSSAASFCQLLDAPDIPGFYGSELSRASTIAKVLQLLEQLDPKERAAACGGLAVHAGEAVLKNEVTIVVNSKADMLLKQISSDYLSEHVDKLVAELDKWTKAKDWRRLQGPLSALGMLNPGMLSGHVATVINAVNYAQSVPEEFRLARKQMTAWVHRVQAVALEQLTTVKGDEELRSCTELLRTIALDSAECTTAAQHEVVAYSLLLYLRSVDQALGAQLLADGKPLRSKLLNLFDGKCLLSGTVRSVLSDTMKVLREHRAYEATLLGLVTDISALLMTELAGSSITPASSSTFGAPSSRAVPILDAVLPYVALMSSEAISSLLKWLASTTDSSLGKKVLEELATNANAQALKANQGLANALAEKGELEELKQLARTELLPKIDPNVSTGKEFDFDF